MNKIPDMILYEDKDIIVCHKRAGVPVQSRNIRQQDMVSMLNNHLSGTSESIHVVHRLDQPVEGVIVFAKNKKAAASLSQQISADRMEKVYQAVCCVDNPGKCGWSEGDSCHLVDYLVKDGRANTSRIAQKEEKEAKRSELIYRVKAIEGNFILAEINLKTGRFHQIRVQMAHAGMPLYGDRKYNPGWEDYQKLLMQEKGIAAAGLALCAVSLTFSHPGTGKQMYFEVKPENPAFQIK